jgi:hypothetical protein
MGPFQIKVRSRLPSLSVQRWLILSFLFLFNHFFLLVYFFFPYYIGKEILSISFLSIMLGKKSFLFLFAQLCVCVFSLSFAKNYPAGNHRTPSEPSEPCMVLPLPVAGTEGGEICWKVNISFAQAKVKGRVVRNPLRGRSEAVALSAETESC